MTRTLLTITAFAGVVGSFALTVRDIYRLADRACGPGEAGGNCQAFASYYAHTDTALFAVFAIGLAVLILVQNFRSADK